MHFYLSFSFLSYYSEESFNSLTPVSEFCVSFSPSFTLLIVLLLSHFDLWPFKAYKGEVCKYISLQVLFYSLKYKFMCGKISTIHSCQEEKSKISFSTYLLCLTTCLLYLVNVGIKISNIWYAAENIYSV